MVTQAAYKPVTMPDGIGTGEMEAGPQSDAAVPSRFGALELWPCTTGKLNGAATVEDTQALSSRSNKH